MSEFAWWIRWFISWWLFLGSEHFSICAHLSLVSLKPYPYNLWMFISILHQWKTPSWSEKNIYLSILFYIYLYPVYNPYLHLYQYMCVYHYTNINIGCSWLFHILSGGYPKMWHSNSWETYGKKYDQLYYLSNCWVTHFPADSYVRPRCLPHSAAQPALTCDCAGGYHNGGRNCKSLVVDGCSWCQQAKHAG